MGFLLYVHATNDEPRTIYLSDTVRIDPVKLQIPSKLLFFAGRMLRKGVLPMPSTGLMSDGADWECTIIRAS